MRHEMICYKITDRHMRTWGCQWKTGEWKRARGYDGRCFLGMIHSYNHPLIAALHDPMYGDYLRDPSAMMFKCEARGMVKHDGQLVMGCEKLRVMEEIEMPKITMEQRIRYAILCAAEIVPLSRDWGRSWWAWAINWWARLDRDGISADAAQRTAEMAAAWEASHAAWKARSAPGSASLAAARAAWNSCVNSDLDLITLAKMAISDDPKWT